MGKTKKKKLTKQLAKENQKKKLKTVMILRTTINLDGSSIHVQKVNAINKMKIIT